MENGTLVRYIELNSDVDRARLLRETCDAITFLHRSSIIHGDIKANNILLSDDGHALLCDFGLAKNAESVTSSVMKGAGNAQWQAPELWDNAPRSFKSDSYSFGMRIIEVVTGTPPFAELRNDAIIKAVFYDHKRPSRPTFPPAISLLSNYLWDVAEMCCVWDSAERLHMEAAELRVQLEAGRSAVQTNGGQDDDSRTLALQTNSPTRPEPSLKHDDRLDLTVAVKPLPFPSSELAKGPTHRNSGQDNGGLKLKPDQLRYSNGSQVEAEESPLSELVETTPADPSYALETLSPNNRDLRSSDSPPVSSPPHTSSASIVPPPAKDELPTTPTKNGFMSEYICNPPPSNPREGMEFVPGMTTLDQIGVPDHQGWIKKRGDTLNVWKPKLFMLMGVHLYFVNALIKPRIEGYINISGYYVIADQNVRPGHYGFRIIHNTGQTHYFSSEEHAVALGWVKVLIKATIWRDYSQPALSTKFVPTISLSAAQARRAVWYWK